MYVSDFFREEVGADMSLISFAKFGLIVQRERYCLGTSPDAVEMLVDRNGSLLILASDTDILSALVDSLSNNQVGLLDCAYKYCNLDKKKVTFELYQKLDS